MCHTRDTGVLFAPMVEHQLLHIAVHFMHTPRISRQAADRDRTTEATKVETARAMQAAGTVHLTAMNLVTKGKRRFRACSRRIFPLGLSRQAIALPCLLREPRGIGLGIDKTHVEHRKLSVLPAIVTWARIARSRTKTRVITQSHTMAHQGEILLHRDFMLWAFAVLSCELLEW